MRVRVRARVAVSSPRAAGRPWRSRRRPRSRRRRPRETGHPSPHRPGRRCRPRSARLQHGQPHSDACAKAAHTARTRPALQPKGRRMQVERGASSGRAGRPRAVARVCPERYAGLGQPRAVRRSDDASDRAEPPISRPHSAVTLKSSRRAASERTTCCPVRVSAPTTSTRSGAGLIADVWVPAGLQPAALGDTPATREALRGPVSRQTGCRPASAARYLSPKLAANMRSSSAQWLPGAVRLKTTSQENVGNLEGI